MEIEEAKTKIDYDRQLAMFGKERADTVLQFYMLGANENEQQLFIEQRQNEMLIKECENLKKESEGDWFRIVARDELIKEREKEIEELKVENSQLKYKFLPKPRLCADCGSEKDSVRWRGIFNGLQCDECKNDQDVEDTECH